MSAPLDWTREGGDWVKVMTASPITRNSGNVAGDATEQILDFCPLPVGLVTKNSLIDIWSLWDHPDGAITKNLAIRMDGFPFASPPSGATAVLTSAPLANLSTALTGMVRMANSLSAQSIYNGNGGRGGMAGTNAVRITAVDFSVARWITFCAGWTGAQLSKTITLHGWRVAVTRG